MLAGILGLLVSRILVRVFIVNISNFLEHLYVMSYLSYIEKDSIVSINESFKNCILACKIGNQIHTKFTERKASQAVCLLSEFAKMHAIEKLIKLIHEN